MEDEYWKKRYEKLLELVDGIWNSKQKWQELVEEQIEVEEIEQLYEGTAEDAKVRRDLRHDTP